ncbi:MAG TPA: lipase secretion chaperone [Pseudomonas sp.]|nr:lipase secretion chaperone [Pseudomonas sp.]
MGKFLLLGAASALIAVLAAVTLDWQPAPPLQPALASVPIAPDANSPAAVRQANQTLAATPLTALPTLGPLPASLQGSSHDVRLQVDADGNLVLHADILHLFEFYLSALLEEPLEHSLARISLALAEQLQGAALNQARDLLRRYVEYKLALADLDRLPVIANSAGDYSLDKVAERQQQLQSLRLAHFSAQEHDAFFAEDELHDRYMQQYLALPKDLTPEQRQQAIAQLELQLPEPVRQAREQVTRHTQLYEEVETLKGQGASAEALFQLRARRLGPQAATALAELDKRQAAWTGRLEAFDQARAAIGQSGLSPEDQRHAIEGLIERDFDASEQLQVRAMTLYPPS